MNISKLIKVLMVLLIAVSFSACESEEEKQNQIIVNMDNLIKESSMERAKKAYLMKEGTFKPDDYVAYATEQTKKETEILLAAATAKKQEDSVKRQMIALGLSKSADTKEKDIAEKVYDKMTNSHLYQAGVRRGGQLNIRNMSNEEYKIWRAVKAKMAEEKLKAKR